MILQSASFKGNRGGPVTRKSLVGRAHTNIFRLSFTFVLRLECGSLLFRSAVPEQFVFALLSLFMSALVGGLVVYTHVFEAATALPESGVLFPLLVGMQTIFMRAGLYSVSHGSQFNSKK